MRMARAGIRGSRPELNRPLGTKLESPLSEAPTREGHLGNGTLAALPLLSTDTPSLAIAPDARFVIDLTVPDNLTVQLDDRPYLTHRTGLHAASRLELLLKRLIDLVGSALGLVIFSPVFLIVACTVKLTSPGPVLFRQRRVGKNGREFLMSKFRSMQDGAEADRYNLSDWNECEGPIFKIHHDPRITPVGQLLRRTSMDELPQLWDVLRGKMSLVGPRPPLPAEVEEYSAWEHQRLSVRPGLTCIWQVSGRSEVSFETWVAMDIDYIRRWSVWLDFKLLALTVRAVVSGRGAY